MAKASLQAAFDIGFASVRGYINRSFAEFEQRLIALEAKQSGLQYCGTWREGNQYEPGNMTTHAGNLWHCEQATTSKPGPDANWRSAVKNGTFSK